MWKAKNLIVAISEYLSLFRSDVILPIAADIDWNTKKKDRMNLLTVTFAGVNDRDYSRTDGREKFEGDQRQNFEWAGF